MRFFVISLARCKGVLFFVGLKDGGPPGICNGHTVEHGEISDSRVLKKMKSVGELVGE